MKKYFKVNVKTGAKKEDVIFRVVGYNTLYFGKFRNVGLVGLVFSRPIVRPMSFAVF